MSPDLPLISLNCSPHNKACTQCQSDEETRVRLVPKYPCAACSLVSWGVEHQPHDMEGGATSHQAYLKRAKMGTCNGTHSNTEQPNQYVNCYPIGGSYHCKQLSRDNATQNSTCTRHTLVAYLSYQTTKYHWDILSFLVFSFY